jgi:uncharacterized protein (TIGR03067 family)
MNRFLIPSTLLLLFGTVVFSGDRADVQEVLRKPTGKVVNCKANTPLRAAVDSLAKDFALTIRIDAKAFQKEGVTDVGARPVRLLWGHDAGHTKLRLGTVLQLLSSQVQGTYQVEKGQVVIVPRPKGKTLVDLLPPPSEAIQAQMKEKSKGETSLLRDTEPLKEALGYLSDVFDVEIDFDEEAFRVAKVKDIAEVPVQFGKHPPGVTLGSFLDKVLKQASATYVLREDLILVVPAPRVRKDVDPKLIAAELALLSGTWVYERQVVEGRQIDLAELGSSTIVIAGNRLTMNLEIPGKVKLSPTPSTISLDPTIAPKQMDKELEIGGERFWHVGLYKLEGDKLTLCYDNTGNRRPSRFESPKRSSLVLTVLRRQGK